MRNPQKLDGSRFCTVKRAARAVHAGRAYMDASGYLVFIGKPQADAKTSNGPVGLLLNTVDAFSGCDARPGMPVLPPSGEVLAKLASRRSVIRPPMREARV